MAWLRARTAFFAPAALILALIALGVDWLISDARPKETLVYLILGLGGVGLLALKWSVLQRQRARQKQHEET